MYTYFSLTKSSPFVHFYSDFRLNLVRSKVPRISSLANPKLAAAEGKQIPSREERKQTRFHKRRKLLSVLLLVSKRSSSSYVLCLCLCLSVPEDHHQAAWHAWPGTAADLHFSQRWSGMHQLFVSAFYWPQHWCLFYEILSIKNMFSSVNSLVSSGWQLLGCDFFFWDICGLCWRN